MASSEKKKGGVLEASDLGEMLLDAVAHDDKKLTKTALKSGACRKLNFKTFYFAAAF